jgi:diaminohydroxyphosphoribosylaminopyrimidine deaminase/5-amino-6-(5-phosphoribosylamino)uracil reductase
MRQALRLAEKGVGRTSPNPAVGAILVKDGNIVGSGWHHAAGMPHAEIEAIAAAGPLAHGADLYVTLEPCSHAGRTGPCVDAILKAGVRRVCAAMEDPNPLVSGSGFRALLAAGIEVSTGLMESVAREINRGWVHWIVKRIPHVTLKLAVSFDGQIAGATGESRWVTGERSRTQVHRMRSECDAVLVGGNTAIQDDPLLTSRVKGGRDPVRIVLTSRPDALLPLRMFSEDSERNIVIVPDMTSKGAIEAIRSKGASVIILPAPAGCIRSSDILDELAKKGITTLLVEGGGKTAGVFLRDSAVDRLVMFYAPVMFGEAVRSVSGWAAGTPAEGRRFAISRVRRMGNDVMIESLPIFESRLPGRA